MRTPLELLVPRPPAPPSDVRFDGRMSVCGYTTMLSSTTANGRGNALLSLIDCPLSCYLLEREYGQAGRWVFGVVYASCISIHRCIKMSVSVLYLHPIIIGRYSSV